MSPKRGKQKKPIGIGPVKLHQSPGRRFGGNNRRDPGPANDIKISRNST
jgi:hypothetical protein